MIFKKESKESKEFIENKPLIEIVYFAYLLPTRWEEIVKEQLSHLKSQKLYEEAVNIYMTVISNNEELNKLKNLLSIEYPKIKLKNIMTENVYEYSGIKTLFDISQEYSKKDTIILYFHSKGMTSGKEYNENELYNPHNTRRVLSKYTIENYEEYLNEFIINPNLDIGGIIPHNDGFIYFNFFWIRSSYIKNYCIEPYISEDRFIWEVWFGNHLKIHKIKDINSYSPFIKYDKCKEPWLIYYNMFLKY